MHACVPHNETHGVYNKEMEDSEIEIAHMYSIEHQVMLLCVQTVVLATKCRNTSPGVSDKHSVHKVSFDHSGFSVRTVIQL